MKYPLRFVTSVGVALTSHRRRLLSIIALLILAMLVLKAWRLYDAAQSLDQDMRAIERLARTTPDTSALVSLGPLLTKTHRDAVALRAEAAPLLPITRYLGWVPVYGSDLAAAEPLLDVATNLSGAAEESFAALSPLLLDRDDTRPPGAALATRLALARPQLERAREAVTRATAAWSQVSIETLSPPLRDRLRRVESLLPLARDGVDLALVLPALLGADGRRDYLLLAQNTDELRATGGFISGAGVLTVDRGRLVDFAIGDSVAVDNLPARPYPDPPEPLLRYMNIELWLFRDSNWSPDFPTSARAAADLYRLGQERNLTNVIAFDPAAIQLLLSALGPVSVEDIPYPISAENVLQELREPHGLPVDTGREEFKRQLGKAMIARLEAGRAKLDILALAGAVRRALDERHILIYVPDPGAAAILAERGWDGAVRPGPADFLMVVDTNMGYNKVNPNIQEEVTYTVDLSDPGAPVAELAVRHIHRLKDTRDCKQWDTEGSGYEEWMTRCYYDYLRVLIPRGSALLDATVGRVPGEWMDSGVGDDGTIEQSEDATGASVLSTFLVVPHGEERETIFRYRLPPDVLTKDDRGWHYRLRLQKQAGRDSMLFSINIRPPRAATISSTSVRPTIRADGTLSFAFSLNHDQALDVTLQLP